MAHYNANDGLEKDFSRTSWKDDTSEADGLTAK